jgi:hypothetical protein
VPAFLHRDGARGIGMLESGVPKVPAILLPDLKMKLY